MSPFSRKPIPTDAIAAGERMGLLAAIVNCASDAIIGVDLNGEILSWNPAASLLYGYRARDIIGQPMSRIIPRNRHDQLAALLVRIGDGEHYHGLESVHHTASGREIAVTMTASPVSHEEGQIIAMAAFVRGHSHSRIARSAHALRAEIPTQQVTTRTILVVENEPLIGLSLALMLENMGFDVIGPVATMAEAMAMLDNHPCALAIIDAHLARGETSAPLAQRLKREGIPFLALYSNAADARPAIFHEVRNFPKPLNARALVAAVHDVLG